MPIKGRPRLVASKASGTKLFVDDLRELTRLTQTENKTASDLIRELVHEALVIRRQRAIGRDEAEHPLRQMQQQAMAAELNPLARDLSAIKSLLTRHAQAAALLTEVLGFSMAAEMKTHLLLHNFLLTRGVTEEAAQALIAEHETRSRQQTQSILARWQAVETNAAPTTETERGA